MCDTLHSYILNMQCKGSIFLVTDLFQNDCMGVQFVGSIGLGLVSFFVLFINYGQFACHYGYFFVFLYNIWLLFSCQ